MEIACLQSLAAYKKQLVQFQMGGWLNVVQPMFHLVGGSPGLSHTLVVGKDTACTAFLLE